MTPKMTPKLIPISLLQGGVSTGTWTVNEDGQYGVLNGTVEDVPALKAPGFITANGGGHFVDVSQFIDGDLILKVRSSTANYTGFRVSFAAGILVVPEYACASGAALPFSGGCYKAHYAVPAGDDFSEVRIPFNQFSDHWNSATGELTKTCAEHPEVCPTAHELRHIKRIDFWAEGVKGDVHLEIMSVSAGVAVPKAAKVGQVPAEHNICRGPIKQDQLLYGYKHRTTSDYLPVAVDESETLAEAVCCDKRMYYLAEPR